VDEMIGQQQIVIKGVPEYFGNVRGVSGFAILADGEVSTILDVTGLVNSLEGLLSEQPEQLH
jgi:two-component system chemotaxis sensor kinase CheA